MQGSSNKTQISDSKSEQDRHFHAIYRQFQNSTPETFRKISFEAFCLLHGPNFPTKAFRSIEDLEIWYRVILYAWLSDAFKVADLWHNKLPSNENELALFNLVFEARNTGIRRIQRYIFRDAEDVPRELPIYSYSDLNRWCDFMFILLNDEDEHVSHQRKTLTLRYDKGVAYDVEEDRKELFEKHDKFMASFMHSFAKAVRKGKPRMVEPDDDWLLVVWSGLAKDKSAREATVSLFIDSEESSKKPHLKLLDDMISTTWKAMRGLGSVCRDEPQVSTPKQVRRHLDAVKRFCSRQIGGNSESVFVNRSAPEPSLENSRFRKILNIINETMVAMERHPRVYKGRSEEDLRDQLLTVFASHYPNATGETFNKKGKTDILIRHEGANIFVGECKFWKGLKSFHKTVDQILGYLTWRDSKAAIICFVKKKELNPVLEQISTGTPEHSCFVRMESKKSESWTQFEFRLKSDPTRNVHLVVLCFHFPPT